ncbi:hypothetical protein Pr1d_31930 [Bythopirellula goksoeyrii]|uniref:Uncharacterized protein n=1 Tax=Bythopirellula goksoeyrii TaxID=1400387 RepID=A0A5B9QA84_9BACT|nr:hypothetical protein Pr1d_31930 [Bythopirellula goksoeyrii]
MEPAIVFRHYDNSKRAIALLGVVLALSSGFQQAHWLCELGGCKAAAVAVTSCEHHCAVTHSCSHSHGCNADKPSGSEDCSGSQNGSCPCPPECWCHQAPQPLELPRSAPEPNELLLQGFVGGTVSVSAVANCDSASLHISAWANEAMVESSPERCAHLCRFLI